MILLKAAQGMYREYIIEQRIRGQEFVLYQCPQEEVQAPRGNRRRLVGSFFIALSFLSLFILLSPIAFEEIKFRLHPNTVVAEKTKIQPDDSPFGELLWLNDKKLDNPQDWEFNLMIPKIGVNSNVVANVDPNNKEIYYAALKQGLAHAEGTSFPDQNGTTYIFGHSSNLLWDANRDKAIFYLLKNLDKDDEIILFYKKHRFVYQVIKKDIKEPTQIPSYVQQTNEKLLVLQTCWPPGTAWKRLFIVARFIESQQ